MGNTASEFTDTLHPLPALYLQMGKAEGVINAEIPNCWECPRCTQEGRTSKDSGEGPGRRRADNGEEGASLGSGWKLTEEPPLPPPQPRRKGPLPAGPPPEDVPGPPKRKEREAGNEPPTPRKKVSQGASSLGPAQGNLGAVILSPLREPAPERQCSIGSPTLGGCWEMQFSRC